MKKSAKFAASSLVALSLLGAACAKDEPEKQSAATTTTKAATTDTEAAATGLEVGDAWCRKSPKMAEAGGCYLIITNGGSADDALISAAVDASVATTTEIHETVAADGAGNDGATETTMAGEHGASSDMSGDHDMPDDSGTTMPGTGMMKMQKVDKIEIPAGETVKLEPGGYHIMLMGLAGELTEGSKITITLTFAEAGEKTVEAEVRAF